MTTETAETGHSRTDCDEAIRRLHDYLAGELDDARRAAIARHLDACGPCVAAFHFEAELRVVISSRAAEVVPRGLRERIRRQIDGVGA